MHSSISLTTAKLITLNQYYIFFFIIVNIFGGCKLIISTCGYKMLIVSFPGQARTYKFKIRWKKKYKREEMAGRIGRQVGLCRGTGDFVAVKLYKYQCTCDMRWYNSFFLSVICCINARAKGLVSATCPFISYFGEVI